jgi:hypothetical protein
MLFKNSVRTSKRTPHFITKINWLTLFKFKPFLRTKRTAGTGKGALSAVKGGMLTLTSLLSWLRSDQRLMRLVGTSTRQAMCPLRKERLLDGCLGVEPDLHDWGRRAVPVFQLYPGICLTTEEKHGTPQSGSPASVCRLGRLFRGSFEWLAENRCQREREKRKWVIVWDTTFKRGREKLSLRQWRSPGSDRSSFW